LIADAQAAGEIGGHDDPDRVAMAVLATPQGLAALVTSGMTGNRPVDTVITGTVQTLLRGLLPTTSPDSWGFRAGHQILR
jgi:hypothetical protein